ncbi:MAG: AAA family ATPase [Bacteriovoracaceae bacterium]|nr:AAA family ATPase [Bacteriovoracaceae bacterium]
MTFIGRSTEIKKLRSLVKLPHSTIGVIYGRRRVGKTTLVKEAFKDHNVLSFEGLEGQSKQKQIRNFLSQLKIQRPDCKQCKASNWSEALLSLLPHIDSSSSTIIFIDEFQWLANYRNDLISDLKMVWDQYLSKRNNITLILCGSIASFMKDKVVHSKALYGRTHLTINLRPFKLKEIKLMLKGRSSQEIIEASLCLGGIPKYLDLFQSYSSLHLGLEELAFSRNGQLVEEFDKIFLSHFGKNEHYQQIMQVLAKHPYGLSRKELAKKAKIPEGGQLSKELSDLQSADFIMGQTPFHHTVNSRDIRYILKDAYCRFYFSFIKPNLKEIDYGLENIFLDIVNTPAYYSWLGRSFEYLCMDHGKELAELLGFSAVKYRVGPYFKSKSQSAKGVQIDLLFDRADNVITICEMKYRSSHIGVQIIEEIKKKQEVLEKTFKKTIHKVLITKSNPTRELIDQHYFHQIIQVEQLLI